MWPRENMRATIIIRDVLSKSLSIFVTFNNTVYINDNQKNKQVNMWTRNSTAPIQVMTVKTFCYGLFVDINNSIYCSLKESHKVVKKWMNSNENVAAVVAGTGKAGSKQNQLNSPFGIFVDVNFNLYVADCKNNRIQRFKSGNLTGATVVRKTRKSSFTLKCPTGIILDNDGNLYIADGLHRIVRSGLHGTQCVAACSNKPGSSGYRLSVPRSLSFDSFGNIFVADKNNNRIQKFLFLKNSCGMCFIYFYLDPLL